MRVLLALVCACAWAAAGAGAARVLGVFGHVGKSHFDAFEPLMLALARRGHHVTVVSHFPQERAPPNYTDISLKGTITSFSPVGQIDVNSLQTRDVYSVWQQHQMLSGLAAEGCEATFAHPQVRQLLRSNASFDLFITELFTTDCYVAFAHHFKVPHVVMSSCVLMPWANARFGNVYNPAFVPDIFHDFGARMTFWQRVQNTALLLSDLLIYEFLYHRPTEAIARRHFGDELPPVKDIAANASLMLVNSHFSLNTARPTVPAVVEVGGIHLPPPKPLPKDLQAYLDAASEGVVYFNMGSMIRAATVPVAKRQAFLDAFARLGLRVLWKWEEDAMDGQPPNVKTSKWLPQFDVLSHPNVRVYIGHGGLLGSIEAAHCGVPMVAIPIFGDQRVNVHNLVLAGVAKRLDFDDITADSVYDAVTEVLSDPKYRENARALSAAYRDRPQSPLDAAVYWTEYVLRHGGAPRLRSPAAALAPHQLLLLDVAAFGALVAALAAALLYSLCARFTARARMHAKIKGE